MKKVFTILAGIAFSSGVFAQNIPNGGFENWSSPLTPNGWSTIASAYGGAAGGTLATQDTVAADVIQGHSSLKLINDTVPLAGMNVIGECGVGSNSSAGGVTFNGYPYAKRPDTLFFYYKYTPAGTDTASMLLNLSRGGTSLFAGEYLIPLVPTAGQWQLSYIPLNTLYTSAGVSDTLKLVFASGNLAKEPTVIRGSVLNVDSVYFDASVNVVNGIEELNGVVTGINAYPNPTTDKINIAIAQDEVGSRIQMFDMSGREVYNGILSSTTSSVDVHGFVAGVYAIRVSSIDRLTIYNGKISVTK